MENNRKYEDFKKELESLTESDWNNETVAYVLGYTSAIYSKAAIDKEQLKEILKIIPKKIEIENKINI